MKQTRMKAAGLALGFSLLGSIAHATPILSMTIEEIGVASGGLGNSAATLGGGAFYIGPSHPAPPAIANSFSSAGSIDNAIIMGTTQGDGAFTPGFNFAGLLITPNTVSGAPSGLINGGNILLDMSGWGANTDFLGFFPQSPDSGILASVAQIDSAHFFYTADWSHMITDAENPDGSLVGFVVNWHLEGIATTVPEPGTIWLVGAALLGLMGMRRHRFA